MTNPPRSASRSPLLALAASFALLAGCDNIGRAFDPDVDPNDPGGGTAESIVSVPSPGGDVRTGRPTVRAAYPTGAGWPLTVPVVVEFSESVNPSSIRPTTATGTDGRIVLRVRGSPQPLPCDYRFEAGDRLLILRPLSPLTNAQSPTYEVVLLPDARDADGVRFDVPAEGKVLAEFQVNQDESITDGRVLALYPRENVRDFPREGNVWIVFDREATTASLSSTTIQLRQRGGATVPAQVSTPISTLGPGDGRIVRVNPTPVLADSTEYELVFNAGITFGSKGELDFRGRTPFSRFETVGPAAPASVELQNFAAGFPNKINIGNSLDAVLRVVPPDDARTGDRVRVRVYGLDADTTAAGDQGFVERSAELTQDGNTPVDVDFTGAFGTLQRPKFDEGEVTFVAQMQRGSQSSGLIHHGGSAAPRFDVVPPAIVRMGAPSAGNGTDVWVDTEHAAVWGEASERLSSADLAADGGRTATMFASDADGFFLLRPVLLGRLTDPIAYNLTVVDLAGNMAAATFSGSIAQRGAVTGALGSQLVVEAYDQATLAPIAGATVLVDAGVPTVPATSRTTGVTGPGGRVVLTPLATSHTVTIAAPGYCLVTMYDTPAGFVSLPLRPLVNPTATFSGDLTFAGSSATAVVGSTALADRSPMGVRTTSAAPATIPSAGLVPNRPQLVTAFAGTIEPTGSPAFSAHGAQFLGPTLTEPTPPSPPAAGGAQAAVDVALLPSTGQTTQSPSWNRDFGTATGLDLGNLVGGKPRVRVTTTLLGFESQALIGLGTASGPTGTSFATEGTLSGPIALGLQPFASGLVWVAVEAEDGNGRLSRTRGLISSPFVFAFQPVPPLPVITQPSGPSAGSPAVTFVDGIGTEALTTFDVTATDGNGRRWLMFVTDSDAAGGTNTAQFPDLAGVTGLAAGTWTVRVEGRQWVAPTTGMTAADFLLTERVRSEVEYARATTVAFTVQ
jgi:hypothetical protein